MVVDTTLFNDEFDMLDIRLELTQHWVDRWVICEGSRTMSGKPKPFHLSENIERYRPWGDRIRVIALDIPETWTNWDIENGQRAALLPGYEDVDDNDIVMHSDLDEILNPDLVPEIIALMDQHDQPVTCSLEMYIYRFDQRVDRTWAGNVVARKRMFQDPCTLYKGPLAGVGHAQKRKDRSLCVHFPQLAGWHWGWMGNDDVVANKARSCIETQHRDTTQMLESFHNLDAASAINRKCETSLIVTEYPEQVDQVLRKYPYWTESSSD
jgi:hypothetical protein